MYLDVDVFFLKYSIKYQFHDRSYGSSNCYIACLTKDVKIVHACSIDNDLFLYIFLNLHLYFAS